MLVVVDEDEHPRLVVDAEGGRLADGRRFRATGLKAALSALQSEDTLVVWRLDRLGRSLVKLVQLMDDLGRRGIHFHSLLENIDTSSSGGRLVFHMMAALSEFERTLISERMRAGMEAAREKGQRLGRRPSLDDDQLREAIRAVRERGELIRDVARRFQVTPRSLRRLIRTADPDAVMPRDQPARRAEDVDQRPIWKAG